MPVTVVPVGKPPAGNLAVVQAGADQLLVRPDGTSESVMASHSLIPEAMRHMFAGLAVLLQPDLRLTRRQQEMIAALVSVQNSCFY